MNVPRPRFAMVSSDIRRDLLAPLVHFTRVDLIHFYRRASYGDLADGELTADLIAYHSPLDLLRGLSATPRPAIIQGVEPFSLRLLPYLYATWAAARWQQTPLVIVTLENRPLSIKHGPLFAQLLRLALRPIFSFARLIIPLNDGACRNVLAVGPFENKMTRLMYGTWGVDATEFTPLRDGREPGFGREDLTAATGVGPILLFVGRLHPEKGVFDLLDAYALVKTAVAGARLIMVGDGPARSEIERRVEECHWGNEVILTGPIKNRDLPPYFRCADVFVAPSITTPKWEEQVGMTNIQAMACGTPVVSTRSGAIPEYVPEGVAGLLVPERDPSALADTIVRLLGDPELRHRLGQGGRAYALEHYDAAVNVRRAEALILERCLGL
jgi:glycosyltransferase involved in cell wall biosynthesis